MPPQDGLRFLFDIQDKISAKLAKIEAKSKSSAAKIDKAFTRASKSQQTNAAKAIANEQKRIIAVEKSHTRAVALLKRESDEFKRSMGRMAAAATVAFAVVAGKAIQMAGGYDLAMRSVQAKTGATGEVLDKLSAQAREMGLTTVHSATEAARGQAFLAQAGFDANEILEALPATLALATAGELDLASAADIASNVLSGFRLETDQAARVADVLAKAADSSNTNVAQLGAALAKAAPSAAAAKWSLEETAAAIGKLSDAGIQGEEAGTALKTMMAKLAIDGGPAEKLMAKMGITVKDTTTGAMLPLNDILMALAPHADDVGLQMELLGTRGGNAGLVLGAVAQNAAVLTEELIDSAGWAQKNADIMSGGLWGAIKKIQSIIESAYNSFGERFTPAVQTLAKVFDKLPAPIQEVVVIVGSLAGAMGGLMLMMPNVFGAIVQLPGKLVALNAKIGLSTWSVKGLTLAIKNTWRALMGPVGWVIAIGAATVALYKFWKATNSPDKKLAKFEKDLEEVNKKLIKFADISPRLVTELGFQKRALERQITALKQSDEATEDLTATYIDLLPVVELIPPVIRETGEAAKESYVELVDLTLALEKFGLIAKRTPPPIHDISDELDWLKTRFDKVQTVPIGDFLADLGIVAKTSGLEIDTLAGSFSKKDGLFGSLKTGLDGMWAGITGKKGISGLFQNIGKGLTDGIGNLLSGGLASLTSFAMKGVVSLGKKIFGFFGRGKRKREAAAKARLKAEADALAARLKAEAAADAIIYEQQTAAIELLNERASGEMSALEEMVGARLAALKESQASQLSELKAMQQRELDSLAAARQAQLSVVEAAIQRELEDERIKAQLTIDIRKAGTDEEKVIAAQARADEALARLGERDELNALMAEAEARVRARYQDELDTITAHFDDRADILGNRHLSELDVLDSFHSTELQAVKQMNAEELVIMASHHDALLKAEHEFWERKTSSRINAAAAEQQRAAALARGRDLATAMQSDQQSGLFSEFRQHGGPVRAGRQYLVGERGPEMFVPSRSGRIEPNGSSGGGVDAKALAKAVADALHGTRVDVDGRQLGRLTIRHQPLAAAELGGRR